MKRSFVIRPIGVVRSTVKTTEEAPKQGTLEGTEARIVIDPDWAEGLTGLAARVAPPAADRATAPLRAGALRGVAPVRSYRGAARRQSGKIIVICWMHEADRRRLTVRPRGQEDLPERGVFSTRSPHRPNPLSLHTVELLEIRGRVLRIRGMDAIDGTPVVDIKPHSPGLDD